MNKLTTTAIVMTITLLSACGVKTSGVRSLSPDTYTISADDLDEAVAKGTALGLAENHCNEMGKKLLVTQVYKQHRVRYTYDVKFQCLEAGDPRLENPEYETIYRSE
jgi:outer membrane lipopolysaccharide assembly protein LptE/RlpB